MAEPVTESTATTQTKSTSKISDRLVSIGQLVQELQADFPELSISKVRYLEDRGLLSPQRTKGKYRKYSMADAKRLRRILAMQRDEYLPLDVIRRRVDAHASMPGGLPDTAAAKDSTLSMTLSRETPTYTVEEFCQALDADEDFVDGLAEFRLIDRAAETGPAFTESDLEAARICQRLRHFQVEPRHLRVLSSAAEREAGLVEQIATPDLRSGHTDRKEYGLQTAQELGMLLAKLTRLLLRRELRRVV